MSSTTDNIFFTNSGENFLLPKKEPNIPPIITEIASGAETAGSENVEEKIPAKPAIEFTKINGAEIAAAVFVFAHFKKIKSGVKNIPPPTPIRPESNPRAAPIGITR